MDMKKIIIVVIAILVIAVAAFAFIQANSHSTKIEMQSNSTLRNGDMVTVVLKDEYRNVYPNEVIDFKVLDDTGWANKYNATTDDSGQASFMLEGYENGNYTVHANFNGTMYLSPSKSVTELEINDGLY